MTVVDAPAGVAAPEVTAEDRQALRTAVAGFLAERCPEPEVRRVGEQPLGYDPALWALMAGELGLPGLVVPLDHGGSGSSVEELCVVLGETGRALTPGPLLATSWATLVLLAATPGAVTGIAATPTRDWLSGIAAGRLTATVAVEAPSGGMLPPLQVRLDPSGTVHGVVPFVLDGHAAGLLLVVASGPAGPVLVAVDGADPGLVRESLALTDLTRRLARLRFDGVVATPLGGPELVEQALAVGALLVAAELAGTAEASLSGAVAYAKVRTQFGRAIGSYQALKHALADVFLAVESAKAAVRHAAVALASGSLEAAVLAAVAKATCSDAAVLAAETSMQVHGGIGFTWEHPAQLHLKRAKTAELLLGDSRHHRAWLARALGLQESTP